MARLVTRRIDVATDQFFRSARVVTVALALATVNTAGYSRNAPLVTNEPPKAGIMHWGDFSLASTAQDAMTLCEVVLLRARFRVTLNGTNCMGSRSDSQVLVRLENHRFEPPPNLPSLPPIDGAKAFIVASSTSSARAEQVRNEIRAALTERAGRVAFHAPPLPEHY